MKKIFLVSKFSKNPNIYTYASSFYTSLQNLGYDVTSFNNKKNFLPTRHITHDHLPYILKFINNKICNHQLKKQIDLIKPDIVFFIKGDNVTSKTLSCIKKRHSPCFIHFYPDNPFVFWNGNSNKNVLSTLPVFDHFLIWSKMLMPALVSAGARKVYYFPFAYDKKIFTQKIIITKQDRKKFSSDVCFVGTWDKEREIFLTKLVKKLPNIQIAIWGNLWDEHLILNSPLRKYLQKQAIYGKEMIKAFRCTKIVLNFIRQQNMTSHNMRTFEALASNVFMLTQRTEEQTNDPFKEGDNIACFATPEELIKKIAFYLDNDILRKTIAKKGYVLAQKFSLQHVLKQFLESIEHEKKHY